MKTCKRCGHEFLIEEQDLEFYKKVSPKFDGKTFEIPAPTLCADCRQQREIAFRNERNLYHRKCDKCHASIISMFHPNEKIVYCSKCWWEDDFKPLSYGRDFDFSRPFFEQFSELMNEVPLPHLVIGNGENSDYTNYSWVSKNCYLLSASDYNEDCYYSTYLFRSNNCFDCLFVNDSELAYECVDAKKCYACAFLQNCQECTDSYFCYDCRSCNNCLGCVGLRNKSYYIFNERCSKEEYPKKKAEFFGKYKDLNLLREQFNKFELKFPHKYAEIENCDDCSGDHLMSCKNVHLGFDSVESQDSRRIALGLKTKDCFDCVGVAGSELCYESVASPENYGLNFCAITWPKSTFLNYCAMCRMSNNCFGCVSLHKNEYCILNKQYTKEEYEKLVPKIIEHMRAPASADGGKKMGEWGEFFSMTLAPFAYNETLANEYFPMSEEEVSKAGLKWYEDRSEKMYKGPQYEIPENIKDVDEDVCKKILVCEVTGKPYKIIPQELKFYKRMDLPLPRRCPDQRHKDRMAMRNPRRLYERVCSECGVKLMSSYAEGRPEKICCEKCYLKIVK